ncbi:MAG: SAM-dependent methyltransferase [Verrucomicrobiae bacterium]|nr:SAM-dependent methyltransferase [Verrucomicrobiae bacterium]
MRDSLLPGEGERLTVCEFMERALYDPVSGYYTRNIRYVGGSSADFATSASLDPGFSAALASWIEHEISATGDSRRGAGGKWHLIELGGGAGHLASGIQRTLGWSGRRRTQYHIVEVSPVLREAQCSTLGRKAAKVKWHPDVMEALNSAGGRAIIFSNEFVDAFPATVVQWDVESGAWHEVCLEGRGGGRFAEVLVPLSREQSKTSVVFDRACWDSLPLADGQRCEVPLSWLAWLKGWVDKAEAVSLLTIDYGDTFPELYRGRRNGTLRAYLKHQRREGVEVYADPGFQDLTVDVNFTDLQLWGEKAGFETVCFETQREFLERFSNLFSAGEPAAVAAFLRDPAGAGEAFRVLCQRKH